MGEVVCLRAHDGSQVWRVDAHERYKGELHRWGVAESPLVVDDKVIYTTGGEMTSVIALDKENGDEIWKTRSLGGPKAFVSPILYEFNGLRQIIAAVAEYVLGIDPANGDILWTYQNLPEEDDKTRGRATIKTNSPIYEGDEVYISRGYDQVSFMLKMAPDGRSVTEKWTGTTMDTHHGGYVKVGDHLYGSNWESNSKGNWVCLDWKTGEVRYEEKWITKGSVVFADGMLYCYEERSGNISLVTPTPEKFDQVSQFRIEAGSGPHWAHPYISAGKLFIRHGDVLMVFDIENKQG
jgi:outer membrane protein assembly factor BamB